MHSCFTNSGVSMTHDDVALQRSQLEQEISERNEEVRVLRERYEALEGKHTETREDLIVSRDHITTLTKQVLISYTGPRTLQRFSQRFF